MPKRKTVMGTKHYKNDKMETAPQDQQAGQAGMFARLRPLFILPTKLHFKRAQTHHTPPCTAPPLTLNLIQEPQADSNNKTAAAPPAIPHWMTKEVSQIGFFDPDYKAPANIARFTRSPNGYYVYWDVFAFTARVQQHIRTKESRKEDLEVLSLVLPYCLRNSARIWWEEDVEEHLKEMFLGVPVSSCLCVAKTKVSCILVLAGRRNGGG